MLFLVVKNIGEHWAIWARSVFISSLSLFSHPDSSAATATGGNSSSSYFACTCCLHPFPSWKASYVHSLQILPQWISSLVTTRCQQWEELCEPCALTLSQNLCCLCFSSTMSYYEWNNPGVVQKNMRCCCLGCPGLCTMWVSFPWLGSSLHYGKYLQNKKESAWKYHAEYRVSLVCYSLPVLESFIM